MLRLALHCDETARQEVARRLRGATIQASSTAALSECEAVLFAGSTSPGFEQLAGWVSAGKHVLLFAGSWLTSDLLDHLLESARQRSVQLAVMNPDRFLPSRQLLWQQLQAGKLGALGLVRMHRWEPPNSDTTDKPSTVPLLRDLDLGIWLFGQTPNVVFAVEPQGSRHTPCAVAGHGTRSVPATFAGRCFQVHLGFPEGGMALIDYTDRLPAGEGYQSLSIIGAAGAAYADDHQNTQLLFRGGLPQAARVSDASKQLAAMAQEFVDGLSAQRDFTAEASAWRNALAAGAAVERSLASRKAVAWENS